MASGSKGWRGRGTADVIAKLCVIRHGHAPRRACNAQEKAVEARTRQAGKREVREALQEQKE